MSDVTNLRQANNHVEVEGKVSEIALEKSVKDGVEGIRGSITIKTSETNFVKFNVNCNKFKKDGSGENSVYPGIETIMNEYKSIAKNGDEEADWVRVSTKDGINPYYSTNSGRDIVGYKSNFFNRINTEPDPKAEFTVELFVKAVIPEVNSEGETGRVIIKGYMPTYNGIEPLDLVVDEDMADDATTYFEPNNTYEFWGDIVATKQIIKTEKSGGFGKSKIETKTVYKNELLCTGGSDPYDEDDEAKPAYDPQAIALALQERNDRIANIKANGGNTPKTNKKPSGAASGRTLSF